MTRFLAVCASVALSVAALASGGEEIKMRARILVSIDSLFPKDATVNQLADDYFKGHFSSDDIKSRLNKVLKLRGKEKWIESDLVQWRYGDDFEIQDLAATLPQMTSQVRHQLRRDNETAQWTTFASKVNDVGYFDDGGGSFTVTSSKGNLLLGFPPEGATARPPLKSEGLETTFAEGILEGPGRVGPPKENGANFTVRYADSTRSSIRRVDWYWNNRRQRPFESIEFEGSRLTPGRHQFSVMRVTRFTSGRLESVLELRPVRTQALASAPSDAGLEGKQFIDRRLGEGQQRTFKYDGRFPTLEETRRELDAGKKSNVPGPPRSAMFQFMGGFALLAGGVFLWRRAQRS